MLDGLGRDIGTVDEDMYPVLGVLKSLILSMIVLTSTCKHPWIGKILCVHHVFPHKHTVPCGHWAQNMFIFQKSITLYCLNSLILFSLNFFYPLIQASSLATCHPSFFQLLAVKR